MGNMSKQLIVNGTALIRDQYYHLPIFYNKQGQACNGIYGFIKCLLKQICVCEPERMLILLEPEKDWCKELKEQAERLMELLPLLGLAIEGDSEQAKEAVFFMESTSESLPLLDQQKLWSGEAKAALWEMLDSLDGLTGKWSDAKKATSSAICLTTEQKPQEAAAIFAEGSCLGMEYKRGKDTFALGLSSASGEDYFLSGDANAIPWLIAFLEQLLQKKIRLLVSGSKSVYPLVSSCMEQKSCEEAAAPFEDLQLMAYLIHPLKSDYDAETVIWEYLGKGFEGYAEQFGKKTLDHLLIENAAAVQEYVIHLSRGLMEAFPLLNTGLRQAGMERLYRDMEMPLTYVLYKMEQEGIAVDKTELKAYGEELAVTIQKLEASIYEQAGRSFNINSPKQLGEILFDELGLPGAKKTKTGYSTSAEILEKLAPQCPMVKDVLNYRTYTKLKSTYAEGLANYIEEDGRIHTNFNQTITATGRISSTEPNLQNIPMRMELGRRIRKVFMPKGTASETSEFVFVDADYSQIELRILAALAKDPNMIEAYQKKVDIHRSTASKVFHVPLEEVTDLQRRNAKAVNFGIVYGISSFGLSQDLDISTKEAKGYIEEYFATYPAVKQYLEEAKEVAKREGYSTTLFQRRRPIPELSSSNFMQRSFGERVAMNAPIQGTAADIMKLAMLKVYNRLVREGRRARMVLQIHDELLLECPVEEQEEICLLLQEEMIGAVSMAVPLEVEAHAGSNWYEAK